MARLIWRDTGAPPSGAGIAASVVAATWFQCDTDVPSVVVGGAADALTTPPLRRAVTAIGMKATSRLRDRAPCVVPNRCVIASSFPRRAPKARFLAVRRHGGVLGTSRGGALGRS